MFFFFSGFLFPTKVPSAKVFLIKKIRTLLIPYISLSLLFMFIDPRIYNIKFLEHQQFFSEHFSWALLDSDVITTSQAFDWYLFRIFIVGKSGPITGPLWFVETLFLCIVLFFLFRKITQKQIGVIIYSIVTLLLGWLCYWQNIHLPLNIESTFSASFFVGIGFLAKKYMLYFFPSDNNTTQQKIDWKYLGILVVSFLLYWIGLNINGGFDLWNNSVGNLFGFLFVFFSGFVFIFAIFGLFARFTCPLTTVISGILGLFARNSYLFLCLHYIAKTYTKCFFYDCQTWLLPLVVITTIGMSVLCPLFRNKLAWMIGKVA